MNEEKTIKKSSFRVPPNLLDYEKTYRAFSWKDAEKEIPWFSKKRINIAYCAIDYHASNFRKNKVALYWEGENREKRKFTFLELSLLSNQFGNFLKKRGVERGDRVFFFLPRIPELFFGFLGTIKIGAIAGTLFSAFGPEALYDRLSNSQAKILVTNKVLSQRVEKIRRRLPRLKEVILVEDLAAR